MNTMTDEAASTGTSPERLLQLAAAHPGLRPVVALNPRANPALLDWLASLDDPEVNAALAQRETSPQLVHASSDSEQASDTATLGGASPDATGYLTHGYTVDPDYQTSPLPRPMSWLIFAVAILLAIALIAGIVLIAVFVISGSQPVSPAGAVVSTTPGL